MANRVGIEVSLAIAEVAKLANVDVVSAYPITPQTHIVEHLAGLVADGELDAAYIPVESEHSAMSACLGAAATGAREHRPAPASLPSCSRGVSALRYWARRAPFPSLWRGSPL